jgi:two-component system response regulator MprA
MARFRSRQQAGMAFQSSGEVAAAELRFADIELNVARHEVVRSGRFVPLSALEYELLKVFLSHPHVVLSRQQLAHAVWHVTDVESRSNFVDAAVMSLRRRLEATAQPRLIHTVRGYGYALRSEPETASMASDGDGRDGG